MSNYLPRGIRKALIQTGWIENEIAVYSSLLEKGAMNLTNLAEDLCVPISTLQYVIKKLSIKKMIGKGIVNGKPVYMITNVEQLRKWFKGISKEYLLLEAEADRFVKQYDFAPEVFTPKIRFFEGTKGVMQSYRQILKECEDDEIKAFLSVKRKSNLQEFFMTEYIPERIKKRIKMKNIAVESEEGDSYKENDAKEMRQTKIVPKGFFPEVDTEINLFGNFMHCMSFNNKGSFSMILQDKALTDILISIFNMMWQSAEKIMFFEGKEGIKDSYKKMLNLCKEKRIYSIYSIIESQQEDLQKFLHEDYVKLRLKKGIKTKNIATKTDKAIENKNKDEEQKRETIFVDRGYFPLLNSEINLFDDCLHCMSFDDSNCFAFIIKDFFIVQMLKGVFNLLWDSLSK